MPDKREADKYVEIASESGLSYLGKVAGSYAPEVPDELFRSHQTKTEQRVTNGMYDPDVQQSA